MVILNDLDPNAATTSTVPFKKRNRSWEDDRFDVFLSFRGLDTRRTFTDHLYDHLKRADILTFQDDGELERGQNLDQQLENAIKQSSLSIIVFSENYASSKWCLDELLRILEEKKIRGERYKVIPIFYKVEASDVRFQRGSYEEALNRHREKGKASLEKIKAWEAALTEAGNIVGLTLNKGGSETEFIGRIVCDVENSLRNSKNFLNIPQHLLDMNHRAEKVESWLKDEREDKNVLVICGIGGVGKTTIAKHVYNKYFREFEGRCFLPTITLAWDRIGVCRLQSQLLSNMLNKADEIRIYNCDEGSEKITRALCNRKVFVVLDDVNETEQLEALLGHQQRLHPGSKIIVTTRNRSLRKNFIVNPAVYDVEGLNDKDSLELFSWHAFRQLLPIEGYKQLSKEILWRCGGLPLSLKVLGSSLRNKMDVVFWEKQLEKLNEIANPDIQKVMQISYDSLEDNTVKNLFLDVACFFVGEKENYVVYVLDHCGMHATVGIQNLIDRCLITTHDNELMMHQVIQDMGREIVRQEYPDEPGRRSRLWCHKDSFFVLRNHTGTENVQGLVLGRKNIHKVGSDVSSFATNDANPHLLTKVPGCITKAKDVLTRFLPLEEAELKVEAFTKMVNLKFIKLNHVHFNGCCNKFPKRLRWIIWHGFPLEYVPMDLPLENLIALDLQHSKLRKVWKGCKEVKTLKILDMSYSLELCQSPDFRGLPQLEKLILRGCSNLVKVCKTIGILNRLVLLDLKDCRRLRDLPDLPNNVVTLELSGCAVGEFSKERKQFDFYSNSIIKFVFPSIESRPIRLLASLPEFLVKLGLKNCNLTEECFPRDLSPLCSLEDLDLSGNLIRTLPDSIRNLQNSRLHKLSICDCPQLESVIHPPSTVTCMSLLGNKQLQKIKARQHLEDLYLLINEPKVTNYVEWEGCFKRVEAINVERKVIKNLGLESLPIGCLSKVQYEVGIFSTFVQSTEVPACFKTYSTTYTYNDTLRGHGREEVPSHNKIPSMYMGTSKVSYTIPCSSVGNDKIQGLNICFAIRIDLDLSKYLVLRHLRFKVMVGNKTKDLAWSYMVFARFDETTTIEKYKEVEEGAFKKFLWVNTWKCDDLLDAGDELEVSIQVSTHSHSGGEKDFTISVEECGIRTVYDDEYDDLDQNTTRISFGDNESTDRGSLLKWTDKMDNSFSNYRIPGAAHAFGFRLLFAIEESDILEDDRLSFLLHEVSSSCSGDGSKYNWRRMKSDESEDIWTSSWNEASLTNGSVEGIEDELKEWE